MKKVNPAVCDEGGKQIFAQSSEDRIDHCQEQRQIFEICLDDVDS
jgi:hypothetical protein